MKVGTNKNGILYAIYDAETDLPRYIADTFSQACAWLGCTRRTLSRILKTGQPFNGCTVYKIRD